MTTALALVPPAPVCPHDQLERVWGRAMADVERLTEAARAVVDPKPDSMDREAAMAVVRRLAPILPAVLEVLIRAEQLAEAAT